MVAGVLWLAYDYSESTEKSARQFAEETVQHLAVAHDPDYLSHHLSAVGRIQMTPGQQARALYGLKMLGRATTFNIEGTIYDGTEPGDLNPHARFEAHLRYPQTSADLDLLIAHRNGRWQIDELLYFATAPVLATPSPPP